MCKEISIGLESHFFCITLNAHERIPYSLRFFAALRMTGVWAQDDRVRQLDELQELGVNERGGASTIELAGAVPASPRAPGQVSTPSIPGTPAVQEPEFHRFYGSVKINARMMAGNAGKVMEEVVKHLTTLYGANVQVTLEIQADIPGGAPEGDGEDGDGELQDAAV